MAVSSAGGTAHVTPRGTMLHHATPWDRAAARGAGSAPPLISKWERRRWPAGQARVAVVINVAGCGHVDRASARSTLRGLIASTWPHTGQRCDVFRTGLAAQARRIVRAHAVHCTA